MWIYKQLNSDKQNNKVKLSCGDFYLFIDGLNKLLEKY